MPEVVLWPQHAYTCMCNYIHIYACTHNKCSRRQHGAVGAANREHPVPLPIFPVGDGRSGALPSSHPHKESAKGNIDTTTLSPDRGEPTPDAIRTDAARAPAYGSGCCVGEHKRLPHIMRCSPGGLRRPLTVSAVKQDLHAFPQGVDVLHLLDEGVPLLYQNTEGPVRGWFPCSRHSPPTSLGCHSEEHCCPTHCRRSPLAI